MAVMAGCPRTLTSGSRWWASGGTSWRAFGTGSVSALTTVVGPVPAPPATCCRPSSTPSLYNTIWLRSSKPGKLLALLVGMPQGLTSNVTVVLA